MQQCDTVNNAARQS